MMQDHPFSIWTLGGIPGGGAGVPAPGDLESWGATWKTASYEYLIGISARAYGSNAETASMPAFIESQRRLSLAIEQFNVAATAQVAELVKLSRDAGKQATTMIWLTCAIAVLTVMIAALTAVTLWK